MSPALKGRHQLYRRFSVPTGGPGSARGEVGLGFFIGARLARCGAPGGQPYPVIPLAMVLNHPVFQRGAGAALSALVPVPSGIEPVDEFALNNALRAAGRTAPLTMKKIRHNTSPKNRTKPRKPNARRRAAPSLNLPDPRPDVAGADIGAREIALAVPAGGDPQPVRTFATFTADLQAAVAWLRQCGVQSVAMESTGLYWLAFAQLLAAAGIEVVLVNARHVRHVPGRKSDLLDCQWLQYLHSVGLLRGSFRPADAFCAVRSLTRHRESLLAQAADQVRHAHKAMIQMNLQLQHVIDDLTGATGSAIVEAILAGERDPQVLARLRDPRIKASRETLAKSLQGDWRAEHLLVLRLAWESWQHCRRQLAELDAQIQTRLTQLEGRVSAAPLPPVPASPKKRTSALANQPAGAETLRAEYQRILGSDLTAVPGVSLLTVQSFPARSRPGLECLSHRRRLLLLARSLSRHQNQRRARAGHPHPPGQTALRPAPAPGRARPAPRA